MRNLIALVVVLLVGAGVAGGYWLWVGVSAPAPAAQSAGGASGRPTAVEVAPVTVRASVTTTDAVGTILSNESVQLRPEVDGRVDELRFDEGQDVRLGNVLVELDRSIERAQLAQAQAALRLAEANFQRARDLQRSNAGTQRALDEAEAGRLNARAELDLAEARLEKRVIRAPFDGRVGLRRISPGAFVTAGTVIVNLEQIDPLKVDFRIPEVFISVVRPGQTIAVTVDALGQRAFAGVISAIDPLVDEGGRAIVIRATVENDEGLLRPGLFARVRLNLQERNDAVFVPETALLPQGDKQFVFRVVDEAGTKKAARVEVTLGRRELGEVEIRSGLEPGDVIVGAGAAKLREGGVIQAIEREAPPSPPTPTARAADLPRPSYVSRG